MHCVPRDAVFAISCLGGFSFVISTVSDVASGTRLVQATANGGLSLFSSVNTTLHASPALIEATPFSGMDNSGLTGTLHGHFERSRMNAVPSFPYICSLRTPVRYDRLNSLVPMATAFNMALTTRIVDEV